jgi:SNF2 family DNA or RNA helicase
MDFFKNLKKYKKDAFNIIEKNNVIDIIFSKNIYEVEVKDIKSDELFYPFLQIDDEKNILDAFCSCKEVEKSNFCSHIAAAYFVITKNKDPLHIEFKNSFFNHIFKMISALIGFEAKALKKIGDSKYFYLNKSKNEIFSIEALNKKSLVKLNEIVNKKLTEDDKSLKFAAFSFEEIKKYKEGIATDEIKYSLSFLISLAKWFFQKYKKEKAKILFFDKKNNFFSKVLIEFTDIKAIIEIPIKAYFEIIPYLNTIESNLKLFEYGNKEILSIYYDKKEKSFSIKYIEKKMEIENENIKGIKINRFIYIEDVGFYPQKENKLFSKNKINKNEISYFLENYLDVFKKYLKNEKIISDKLFFQYSLYFDDKNNLHIKKYIFDISDFDNENSYIFNGFIYLDSFGFIKIKDDFFEGAKIVIKSEEVSNFINKHKQRFNNFKGFETHYNAIESYLAYELKDNNLVFSSKVKFLEDLDNFIDFEDWIYIKDKGFYFKKDRKDNLLIRGNLKIKGNEISNFIDSHYQELEFIDNFFTSKNPVEKIALEIKLIDEKITVLPKIKLKKGYFLKDISFFSSYGYLKNQGFFKLSKYNHPKKYENKTVISKSEEEFFITYELLRLKPFIIEMDKELKKPKNINLKVLKLKKKIKDNKEYYLADLAYKTDVGLILVKDIAKAIFEKKKYIFSKAGLFFLKDTRFNFLKNLTKRQIYSKSNLLRLTSLEWIRLLIFEDIKALKPSSKEAIAINKLLDEIKNFKSDAILDLSYLKANLRAYQKIGTQWLFFLYCHNLSGLLCDEMGLGKTHQAMALISAIHATNSYKYLMVCPTSVIYHLQDLMQKFLPSIKVYVHHGQNRNLNKFKKDYDLLLSSYGIIKQDIKEIKKIKFELAIFDEIQTAKNQSSLTHKALSQISSNMKLGLSGTPIENYLKELKALFDLVLPNYMPTANVFKELFTNPIEKENDNNAKNLLKKLIRPFILRRKKNEVLKELPEKIEENLYFDLSNEQIKLYNEILDQSSDTIEGIKKEKQSSFVHIFSILSKLKQVCDHPSLINKDVKNFEKYNSSKFELFKELIEEANQSDQKVVIFSQYLNMLQIIKDYLKQKNIAFASITGSTKKRYLEIKKFKEDPNCKIFVASLLAAGVGIDLSNASIVIHYDRWWNPAKENQATDRVHRIGQNRGVQVFKLIAKNSIEEKIHSIIERKHSLIEDTIEVDEIDEIKKLNKEELLSIFIKIS